MERDIPELHEHRLRQMCALGDRPLPKKLSDLYWPRKIVLDRIGAPFSDSDFATIAVEAGFGKLTDREAHPTLIDLFRTKRVEPGVAVKCQHGDKLKTGKLMRVTYANQLGVIFDGDNQETLLDADKVALAA